MDVNRKGRAGLLSKNAVTTVTIEDLAQDGNGVGRADGVVVFVPATAVGDVARVRIAKVTPRCCYGILEELLTPSPDRCAPDCAAFPRCGGCGFRHISYAAECRAKEGWVRESLHRIGGIPIEPLPILPAPSPSGYRNKAIYPAAVQNGRLCIGFYAKRSHRIVGAPDCRLHPPFFADAVAAFRGWIEGNGVSVYDETAHSGLVRALYLRYAEETEQLMATVIANGERLPAQEDLIGRLRAACPQLRSVILNVNRAETNVLLGADCRILWGTDTIEDRLCGLTFSLSPLSFYQVNRAAAERLYGVAAEFAALRAGETLVDLYCGAGTIGLSIAKNTPAASLVGAEIVPQAVANAKANAARNGVANARFLCADAAEAAARLAAEGLRPDAVVVDPPRKGLSPALIETIAQTAPARVVYVSCNPATAARDAALFSRRGYAVRAVQPVDLFPRTGHVESVLLLSRDSETGTEERDGIGSASAV